MKGATFGFTLADQRRFARLSGDFNPVHVDPVEARRVAAGEPIVHGVHLLLKALELQPSTSRRFHSIRIGARFLRPALLGARIGVERTDRGGTRLTVASPGGDPLVDVTIGPGGEPREAQAPTDLRPPRATTPRRPRVRSLDKIAGATGAVALPNRRAVEKAFPRASRLLGGDAVGALLSISRVVGMECPGRDSLLSAIDVQIAHRGSAGVLEWRVARVDTRFRLVRLDVRGGGLHGTVDAFVRPAPEQPPDVKALSARVAAGEFAGQRALVIGGSRGLGAVTALLVVGGGGTALATFARGRKEAAALRRSVGPAGRRLTVAPLDVIADPPRRLVTLLAAFKPTHVYYFATPRIFARRQGPFDAALFRTFADFYLSGFARVCEAARSAGSPITVFFPSTVAIDDTPADLVEYAAAKAAGESICRSLNRPADGFRIVSTRLPRVSTDQTAALIAAPALAPVDALLPILRDLRQADRAGGDRAR